MTNLKKMIDTPRKLFRGVLFLAAAVMASCSSEEMGRHALSVLHPYGVHFVYPGQADSIVFITTDSYDVLPEAEWMRVKYPEQQHGTIKYNPYAEYLVSVAMVFDANNTGSLRYGLTGVKAYEWRVAGEFFQTAWHNIRRPAPVVTEYMELPDGAKVPSKVDFTRTDSAMVAEDAIDFVAYGNWTASLKDDPSWVQIKAGEEGRAGESLIVLAFEQNTSSTEDREAVLELKGSDVTTLVKIKQLHVVDGKSNTGVN